MAISMGLIAFFDFIFMASSILIIIFIQDARSALFAIIPLPFISVRSIVFGRLVGGKFKRAQEAYSNMSDTVQETFAGIRVVKSFVKEWWFNKKFIRTNDEYRKTNMELVRLFGFFFPFISFLSHITVLIMLLIGGRRVILGIMTPGSLVAMFQYLAMLIWPLMGAGYTVNMIQRGAVSLGRVNEILNTKPSILDPENPKTAEAEDSVPAIEIENLTFSYNVAKEEKKEGGSKDSESPQGESSPVLENVSLKVMRGEWLGIMGRTGSGKSSLIKTLTRIVDPPDGAVRVFGLDVRQWPLEGLRKLFAVSPQDSYLFSDSIQNNIAYGLEEGDERREDLLNMAIKSSSLENDLVSFADGRNTTVGERGLTLSGGQKQRAAIARALVMESEFLILDDSLSAVDNETERSILEALARERKGKTTIIISHRVSTLKYADKVLVLDKGKVLEYGSPAGLVADGGFYSRMAALQRLDEGPVRNTGVVNG
jgi:ATP-binding cassette subfamily B protein